MNRRRGIRSLCCAALAVTAVSLSSTLLAAEEVKIGFLVKQAEEPWFQTEWAFAEKAGKDKGFTVIKIAVPDGEKTLSAIDSLAANGAKGFVICPPDVSLGPAIMAKAKLNGMKVIAVDDRFVDANGKFMEDVPYLGMAAFEVGQKQGAAMATEAKKRGWDWKETYAVINTFNELDTGKKRTDGSVKALEDAGMPKDHILFSALKTLDVPGSMDATNSALVKLPGAAKNLIIGGMNDNTVLGGVRATESAGFAASQRDRHRHQRHRCYRRAEESQQRFLRLDAAKPAHRGLQHREHDVRVGHHRQRTTEVHRDGRRDADHSRELQAGTGKDRPVELRAG